MSSADKQTGMLFLGAAAVIAAFWWWSGEVQKQRQLEIALPVGIQDHYDRQSRIPEAVIYER